MTFRCIVPNDIIRVEWMINGISASTEDGLLERGITYNDTLRTNNGTRFSIIRIEARAENNGTKLQCAALTSDSGNRSQIVLLLVQGTF